MLEAKSRAGRTLLAVGALLGFAGIALPQAADFPSPPTIEAVRKYIKSGWMTLSRGNRDLPAAARDPKLKTHRGPWPVYIPAGEDRARVEVELGLSRYFDLGEGPAPEVLADELDEKGRTHYDRVREYYRTHEVADYKEFAEHGTIVEKYDVRRRESDVAADIRFGYSSNEIGFGWTNAAVLELLAGLD